MYSKIYNYDINSEKGKEILKSYLKIYLKNQSAGSVQSNINQVDLNINNYLDELFSVNSKWDSIIKATVFSTKYKSVFSKENIKQNPLIQKKKNPTASQIDLELDYFSKLEIREIQYELFTWIRDNVPNSLIRIKKGSIFSRTVNRLDPKQLDVYQIGSGSKVDFVSDAAKYGVYCNTSILANTVINLVNGRTNNAVMFLKAKKNLVFLNLHPFTKIISRAWKKEFNINNLEWVNKYAITKMELDGICMMDYAEDIDITNSKRINEDCVFKYDRKLSKYLGRFITDQQMKDEDLSLAPSLGNIMLKEIYKIKSDRGQPYITSFDKPSPQQQHGIALPKDSLLKKNQLFLSYEYSSARSYNPIVYFPEFLIFNDEDKGFAKYEIVDLKDILHDKLYKHHVSTLNNDYKLNIFGQNENVEKYNTTNISKEYFKNMDTYPIGIYNQHVDKQPHNQNINIWDQLLKGNESEIQSEYGQNVIKLYSQIQIMVNDFKKINNNLEFHLYDLQIYNDPNFYEFGKEMTELDNNFYEDDNWNLYQEYELITKLHKAALQKRFSKITNRLNSEKKCKLTAEEHPSEYNPLRLFPLFYKDINKNVEILNKFKNELCPINNFQYTKYHPCEKISKKQFKSICDVINLPISKIEDYGKILSLWKKYSSQINIFDFLIFW